MLNEQRFFELALNLIGSAVRIGVVSSGELLEGIVRNAMFDSLLLETPKGKRVISYHDISFIDDV